VPGAGCGVPPSLAFGDRGKHKPHGAPVLPAPPQAARVLSSSGRFVAGLVQPRTETPENDSTANPRTGWPKNRAGSKWLVSSRFSIFDRVSASSGPETIR